MFCHTLFQHNVLHLNMPGLSSKYDQLKMLLSHLSDANIEMYYILLCETFLNDNNAHFLPSYLVTFKLIRTGHLNLKVY